MAFSRIRKDPLIPPDVFRQAEALGLSRVELIVAVRRAHRFTRSPEWNMAYQDLYFLKQGDVIAQIGRMEDSVSSLKMGCEHCRGSGRVLAYSPCYCGGMGCGTCSHTGLLTRKVPCQACELKTTGRGSQDTALMVTLPAGLSQRLHGPTRLVGRYGGPRRVYRFGL